MDYSTLFENSFKLHQELVNILSDAKNDKGVSVISQPEIAKKINRSQTWVASAIKRLNTEDTCIQCIGNSQYMLYYEDLMTQGVFSKILFLIILTRESPSIFLKKDSEIAQEYNVQVKTVQMYKAYLRTGWKINHRNLQ